MDNQPPQRLTNDPNHPDFHPSYMRVGVRIDDVDRDDIIWYDARQAQYRVRGMKMTEVPRLATKIEPYFRHPENRQQRRARERWEGKH